MYPGERFNSISHLIGALLAVAGTAVLVTLAARLGDPWKVVAFSVYGAMLVVLYGASTTYHSVRRRKPAADEAKRKRTYEIVDMAENFAAVRVNLDYPGWRGVDYVVLLKVDGKWMIMRKSWTGTLTQKPA